MNLTKAPTSSRAHSSRRNRNLRRVAAVVGVVVAMLATSACGTWGVKESYRGYIAGPIAHGTVTATDGSLWLDGPTAAKGQFLWTVESSAFDPETETGYVQLNGKVVTSGHDDVLSLTILNPRLEIDGDEGTFVADLNFRPFVGFGPTPLAPLQAQNDVDFATVDLSAVDWTANESGFISIGNAPMTGITAAMQLIGWDQFYGDPVALDALSVVFKPTPPTLAAAPVVSVSRTTNLHFGDTVSVSGRGFDPNAHNGVRPPLAGQPSGVYVVFGKFADAWRPSAGAPSSVRTVIQQKWALPQAQRDFLDPTGTSPSFVALDAQGRFEATVTLTENAAAAGNYGVYVYPASGAVNAPYEHSVLLTPQP
jgi:hypothetical protein